MLRQNKSVKKWIGKFVKGVIKYEINRKRSRKIDSHWLGKLKIKPEDWGGWWDGSYRKFGRFTAVKKLIFWKNYQFEKRLRKF